MRRVLFFLNPLLMERRNRRAAVDRVAGMLRETGCTVELQDTLSAHSAGEQAQEAVTNGFDTIFVCGGDGTIFQVIQGVAGSSTALGVIPFGTGNVLAQNLRLPLNPIEAMRAQMNAPAVPIPLGKITCKTAGHTKDRNWYFVIAAGMGVHAALMNLAPTGSGKRVGGRAAYYAGGIRLLFQHPVEPFDLQMTLADGSVRKCRASEVIAVRVGEINRWRPGGEMRKPVLRVASIPETTRLGLAHASFHALITRKSSGSSQLPYPQYEDVSMLTCNPIPDYSYQSPLLIEADGEVIGMKRATISIAQRQLRLLWPNSAEA
ncbi:diacylglycerol kinase family enzyme [Silvibacterium bohemicum]|uniref:Diacylglycerol kinase family enzyme n=1 Tax=Silvibacterium bohemicum TaxID=1577686 RepID=A0A841JYX0_9BACT|nr:diacylglycerol kinase family protein [Silvibacterium bohemicum]MBB6145835.1 diacylglycerol kinase family enzyme [Silvibacterium bohemicum]